MLVIISKGSGVLNFSALALQIAVRTEAV